MKKRNANWSVHDFSHAMTNAILGMASPKLIGQAHNKISFNGFWRNGDKQNVCIWLDKATWHDAKTGEGGGCKEFAKVAFNMALPEFMKRFGTPFSGSETLDVAKIFDGTDHSRADPSSAVIFSNQKPVDQVFKELCQRDKTREDKAKAWLETERGLINPRFYIGSGFSNLDRKDTSLFDAQQQNFIKHRIALAPQIVVPLRSTKSNEIKNLFFRSIAKVPKEEKSRLLPNSGGWHEPDGSPRAFGFPSLIKESSHLIICEGMADYFTVEFLINGNKGFLPIGASNADGLTKWSKWLVEAGYKGRVTVLHQLDTDDNGRLNPKSIGPKKAVEALRCLKDNRIHAQLFDWPFYLQHTSTHILHINDIADSLSTEATYKECSYEHLQNIFLLSLTMEKGL
jgi:hypothetical protein